MYGLIRLCIGCIVFGCIKLKFKELIKTRRHKIYILVIAAIFSIIFMFIPFENLFITINEQISNFAQSYPANSITASIEAPLLINRYRFVSCSCFSCFCKKA